MLEKFKNLSENGEFTSKRKKERNENINRG